MTKTLHKHLTLEDRKKIEDALSHGSSRSAIAETLGKNKSTICKEVKKHRSIVKRDYGRSSGVYDCFYIQECGLKFCKHPCSRYERVFCSRRDRIVGVCNGCESKNSCRKIKYLYHAFDAHTAYIQELIDSRVGVNLTSSQAKELGDILKPLINNGQSIYSILKNHPELPYSEKTIYNYISDGVFSQSGLYDIDLHLKTKRRPMKSKKVQSKPRVNRAFLKNRLYTDYVAYIKEHPSARIIEMDTVYNDVKHGPFLQTFQFVELKLMIGILQENKTAQSMCEGLQLLKQRLGDRMFKKHVQVILTDRGTEFSAAEEIEKLGVKLFYCDPMCSWQKPHVENNHLLLRRILPKDCDWRKLGVEGQEDIDTVFSHINSYPREELNGRTPIEVLLFFNHGDETILQRLKIKKIDPDSVQLKPSLVKK